MSKLKISRQKIDQTLALEKWKTGKLARFLSNLPGPHKIKNSF